jgi:hypothetical protein
MALFWLGINPRMSEDVKLVSEDIEKKSIKCPRCRGIGYAVYTDYADYDEKVLCRVKCDKCKGNGKINEC